ncbi:MAG: hypothetical protein HY459_04040 [Parcubacteria group bacterium]|nr:hypothetical protein [Parcubacteria group bacterium]
MEDVFARLRRGDSLNIAILVVFVLWIFAVLAFTASGFGDPDSFYHLKVAQLARENGFLTFFTWLPFTIIGNSNFADAHLLYHLTLVPFSGSNVPTVTANIGELVTIAILLGSFVWMAVRLKLRFVSFWVLLFAFGSASLIYRLLELKAISLAAAILLLGYHFLRSRNPVGVLIIGFLGVWTHNSFPLLLVLAAVIAVNRWVLGNDRRWFLMLITISLGIFAGLTLHPNFPQSFNFFYTHIVSFTGGGIARQAGEWAGITNLWQTAQSMALFFFLWFVSYGVWVYRVIVKPSFKGSMTVNEALAILRTEAQKDPSLVVKSELLLISLFFWFLTLFAIRFTDFLIPFGVLAIGVTLDKPLSEGWVRLTEFARRGWDGKILKGIIVIGLVIALGRNVLSVGFERNPPPFDEWKQVSEFIASHTEPNEVVVNAFWDTFPQLFYWNDKNRYVNGLDIGFLCVKKTEACERWLDIFRGRRPHRYAETMRFFNARFAVIPTERGKDVVERFASRDEFEEVYQDQVATVFKLQQ